MKVINNAQVPLLVTVELTGDAAFAQEDEIREIVVKSIAISGEISYGDQGGIKLTGDISPDLYHVTGSELDDACATYKIHRFKTVLDLARAYSELTKRYKALDAKFEARSTASARLNKGLALK